MSDDGINIILPDDMGPEMTDKLAGGGEVSGADKAALLQAQKNAEAKDIEDQIEAITNTQMLPYKDDAPACVGQVGRTAVVMQTRFHEVIQMPAWTHGRCIGAHCGEWQQTQQGGICGKKLVQMHAAKELGLVTGDDILKEFERWAVTEEAPAKKLVDPS